MDESPTQFLAPTQPQRQAMFVATVVLVVLVVFTTACVVTFVAFFGGKYGPDPMPFESARWQVSPVTGAHTSVRQRMVDDLLRSGIILGKSRAEIEALLGPADPHSYESSETMMVYLVGPERGWFSVDGELLRITLDASQTAIDGRLGTN